MTAAYIFSNEGLVALARYVAPDTLFAFDLDGTLAPIVSDYSAVAISEPVKKTLGRLSKLARVIIITGRSRTDARKILGFEPELLVGNHGAEWPDQASGDSPDFKTVCINWQNQLNILLEGILGVEIETKGESLTIHYRKATDPENTHSQITAIVEKLDPPPKIIGGKFVVNLLPLEAPSKGDALIRAMDLFGTKRAVYFGDDVTDEEVFKLTGVDLLGIHIGKDGQTAATYYLKRQSALLGLLNSIVGLMEQHGNNSTSHPA